MVLHSQLISWIRVREIAVRDEPTPPFTLIVWIATDGMLNQIAVWCIVKCSFSCNLNIICLFWALRLIRHWALNLPIHTLKLRGQTRQGWREARGQRIRVRVKHKTGASREKKTFHSWGKIFLARRTTRQDIWFTAIRLVVFMHRGMIHHWAHNCKTSELSNSNSWLLWDRFRGNLGVHLRREIAAFERTLLDPLGI